MAVTRGQSRLDLKIEKGGAGIATIGAVPASVIIQRAVWNRRR